MARTPRQDREIFSIFEDAANSDLWTRRVSDKAAQDILTAILAALGGSPDTTPDTANISMPLANTEYDYSLPANCKGFILRSRKNASIKLAFTSGETSTNYITIPHGNSFEDLQYYQSQTIYFQSTKADDTLEIVTYT